LFVGLNALEYTLLEGPDDFDAELINELDKAITGILELLAGYIGQK